MALGKRTRGDAEDAQPDESVRKRLATVAPGKAASTTSTNASHPASSFGLYDEEEFELDIWGDDDKASSKDAQKMVAINKPEAATNTTSVTDKAANVAQNATATPKDTASRNKELNKAVDALVSEARTTAVASDDLTRQTRTESAAAKTDLKQQSNTESKDAKEQPQESTRVKKGIENKQPSTTEQLPQKDTESTTASINKGDENLADDPTEDHARWAMVWAVDTVLRHQPIMASVLKLNKTGDVVTVPVPVNGVTYECTWRVIGTYDEPTERDKNPPTFTEIPKEVVIPTLATSIPGIKAVAEPAVLPHEKVSSATAPVSTRSNSVVNPVASKSSVTANAAVDTTATPKAKSMAREPLKDKTNTSIKPVASMNTGTSAKTSGAADISKPTNTKKPAETSKSASPVATAQSNVPVPTTAPVQFGTIPNTIIQPTRCRFGANCRDPNGCPYDHTPKQRLCTQINRFDGCKAGPGCEFSHEMQGKPCRNELTKFCENGYKCAYKHLDEKPRGAPGLLPGLTFAPPPSAMQGTSTDLNTGAQAGVSIGKKRGRDDGQEGSANGGNAQPKSKKARGLHSMVASNERYNHSMNSRGRGGSNRGGGSHHNRGSPRGRGNRGARGIQNRRGKP